MVSPATVKEITERISGELRARRVKSLEAAVSAVRVLKKRVGELFDRLERDTMKRADPDLIADALAVNAAVERLSNHEAEARRFKDHLVAMQTEALSQPKPPAKTDDEEPLVTPDDDDGGTSPEEDAEAQAGGEGLPVDPAPQSKAKTKAKGGKGGKGRRKGSSK